jgi:cytochrome oxidase Cu insertion factor (SCO1/SenC/PrrC family)
MKSKLLFFSILAILFAACNSSSDAVTDDEGPPAPQFTLPDAIGTQTSLSDYAGQPILLFFHMAVG